METSSAPLLAPTGLALDHTHYQVHTNILEILEIRTVKTNRALAPLIVTSLLHSRVCLGVPRSAVHETVVMPSTHNNRLRFQLYRVCEIRGIAPLPRRRQKQSNVYFTMLRLLIKKRCPTPPPNTFGSDVYFTILSARIPRPRDCGLIGINFLYFSSKDGGCWVRYRPAQVRSLPRKATGGIVN